MQSTNQANHDRDVASLQNAVQELYLSQKKVPVSLLKSTLHSNTTRSSAYKSSAKKLPIDSLDRMLSIDHDRLVAVCEPRVSMRELAESCFKEGLIPVVVPEFKGITVGGAIMGCGGESSSHKYGLFHDTCNYFELLLGDGQVVKASRQEYSDLFHGVVGSYGSLGVLLSAEVRLQKAKKFVTLNVHRFDSGHKAIDKMNELMHQKTPPEYLEGIIFSEYEAVIIEGNQTDHPADTIYRDNPLSPWYYQFIENQHGTFSMGLIDYIFRYDRGAFWMGSYVFHLPILKKLFMEGIWRLQKPQVFTPEERLHFSKLHDPNVFVRSLAYPITSSQRLYAFLHSCEDWVKDRFIVQDFTLPVTTVNDFYDAVLEISPIFPLWLCPVKANSAHELFAPHSLNGSDSINIGVYGIPSNTHPIAACTKDLEQKLYELQGRKWLYTHSYYTPEEFWNIYPKSAYLALREKYNAEGMWISIEDKVLTNN